MKSSSFCFYSILVFLLVSSCKKDSSPSGPGTPGKAKDSLYVFNGERSLKDTIQYIFRDVESGADFFMFGKRNANDRIEEFTSMIIRKRLAPDTLLHVMLDEQKRIKSFYSSVKNVKDTLLYTVGYTVNEDSVFVNRYFIDWNAGSRILRWSATMKKSGTGYGLDAVTGYRGNEEDNQADLALIIGNFAKIGSVVLIAAGGAAGLGICGLPCGIISASIVAGILSGTTNAANASELPPGIRGNIAGHQVFVTTVKDILISRQWRPASFTENGVEGADPCEADNTYIFGADGRLTILKTGLPCYSGEVTDVVNWNLYDNEQRLFIGEADLGHWIIREIAADRIVLHCVDNSTGLNIQVQLIFRAV